ncbi:MAG TPA: transcriptional coactivator p15/PC4 family protein [Desulfomonilia bacterium]
MADESILVHSFMKNALEEVRVSVSTYKGKKYVDLRVYYQDDNGEYKPSKKGIAISPELLPELENAIGKLKEIIESQE